MRPSYNRAKAACGRSVRTRVEQTDAIAIVNSRTSPQDQFRQPGFFPHFAGKNVGPLLVANDRQVRGVCDRCALVVQQQLRCFIGGQGIEVVVGPIKQSVVAGGHPAGMGRRGRTGAAPPVRERLT